MRKQEVSRKRAAETEKVDELNMEDKEAIPVEEVEVIIRAVSYTHLDVYKRQVICNMTFGTT